MKKLFASFICIVLIAITAVSAIAASFIDVPEDAYYAEAAARMNEKGILTGYGDNRYNGEDNITRAQMAVVAVRLLGEEELAKSIAGTTKFTDFTPALDWATGYVNYVTVKEIMIGDGDGTFRPNDTVKYEEVIKIIVCVLGLDEDVKIVPDDWSREYIEAAEDAGLLKGLIGKKGEPMKRSDIAVICDASITLLEKESEETAADTTKDEPEATTKKTTEDEPEVTTKSTTKATTKATTEKESEVTTETTTEAVTTEVVTEVTTKPEPEPEETTETTETSKPEATTKATTTLGTLFVPSGTIAPVESLGPNELPED